MNHSDMRLNCPYRIELLDGAMVVYGRYWSTYLRTEDNEDFVLVVDESAGDDFSFGVLGLPARQITKIEEVEY